MSWMLVAQISILVAVAGIVIAMLMKMYGDLEKEIRMQMVEQIGNEVTNNYLPKVANAEVEMTEKIMDKIFDKIPDVMEKTMKSTQKMMEEL